MPDEIRAAEPAAPEAAAAAMPAVERADEQRWRDLLLLIEAGEVIPIVGRELLEVPTPSGKKPLYAWLAERVAKTLGVPFDPAQPTGDPLNDVACRYLKDHDDPRQIYITVFEEARGIAALGIPEALQQLASIDRFKLLVTTTFDNCLQAAVDAVRFNGLPRTETRVYTPNDAKDLPAPLEDLKGPLVYHLLGRVSPTANYVVTEEDALEFVYSLQANRPATLFSELFRKDLLVIGCRFPAWLVRFFLRSARPERLLFARGRSAFVVDTGAREDRMLVEFLRAFRTRTEVLGHVSPAEFVAELHRRWQARAARPAAADAAPAPAQAPPGAIFISYASEDRPVAEKVAEALAAAKLEVWLDRDQLMTGDAFEDRIRTNIDQSTIFLPLLSRNCLTRTPRYFRLEWDFALRKARLLPSTVQFLYPVAIDDVPYQAPEIPGELRALTWGSIKDGLTDAFVQAVKTHYRKTQLD
jgi:hypothetical protein